MEELDYYKLIAHQEVARILFNIKEEQENLRKEKSTYANDLKESNITPETYASCMQMNTRRCIKKEDEIQELQK